MDKYVSEKEVRYLSENSVRMLLAFLESANEREIIVKWSGLKGVML